MFCFDCDSREASIFQRDGDQVIDAVCHRCAKRRMAGLPVMLDVWAGKADRDGIPPGATLRAAGEVYTGPSIHMAVTQGGTVEVRR